MPDFLDPLFLVKTFGLIGVWAIIFAESGLFFGFFLPGDSLLFTAGLLASQGHLHLAGLYVGALLAAIIGDSVGYAFGKRVGPAIFTKEDSLFFNKKHVARAQHFYEKHGKMTLVMARFVPVIRTFAPIVAGVGGMNYRTFLTYNMLGGVLWVVGMVSLGFVLGHAVPNIDAYIVPIVLFIIVTSFFPGLWHFLRPKRPE